MTVMKSRFRPIIFACAAILAFASSAGAQSGSVEFVAHATPSSGVEEPVRGFPFFLLSKSFDQIEKEADSAVPKPDLNAFIDKLDSSYSPELKAWMKKNQTVNLIGDNFLKELNATDILGVPEFRRAYMERNAGDQSSGFPQPKVKPDDQIRHPEKFDKLSADYIEAVHHYIDQHPDSIQGIDLSFNDMNPEPKWEEQLGKRRPEIERRALDLAQSKYLAARTQTDLQGQGSLRDLSPGTYWISTLDVAAVTGDTRSRWDVPVTVRSGKTEYVALSNVNSTQPVSSTP